MTCGHWLDIPMGGWQWVKEVGLEEVAAEYPRRDWRFMKAAVGSVVLVCDVMIFLARRE